jgi:hypothetical protein
MEEGETALFAHVARAVGQKNKDGGLAEASCAPVPIRLLQSLVKRQ